MQTQVQYSEKPIQRSQIQSQTNGDFIEQLPSDASVPSHNEIRLVDQFFQQKKSLFDRILHQTKDILILGGLFIIFSLPFIDSLIQKFISVTATSPYILIGVKALLFVLVYFIIKNLYLAKKQ
jgi:hypothetical protein